MKRWPSVSFIGQMHQFKQVGTNQAADKQAQAAKTLSAVGVEIPSHHPPGHSQISLSFLFYWPGTSGNTSYKDLRGEQRAVPK